MSGKILISCKQATNFISKKEEKKLSSVERIQLIIHLIICEFCKLFYKQNSFIINNIKKISVKDELTEEEQKNINRVLEDFINKT